LDIAFQGEPINSIFKDSYGNSVSLKNLLGGSKNYFYNCTYDGCLSSYIGSNPEDSKTFDMKEWEENLIGFYFTGKIEKVSSASFYLSSDASESELNQIQIDFLNDGKIDTGNSKPGFPLVGNETYGCFNDSDSSSEITLSSTPLCERVTINPTPAILIGEWIKEKIAGTNKVTMKFYSKTGILLDQCDLSSSDLTSAGKSAFCGINIMIPEKDDYYVCSSVAQGTGDYKIKGYVSASNNCGFYGNPLKKEEATYRIGIRPLKFATPGTLVIPDVLPL